MDDGDVGRTAEFDDIDGWGQRLMDVEGFLDRVQVEPDAAAPKAADNRAGRRAKPIVVIPGSIEGDLEWPTFPPVVGGRVGIEAIVAVAGHLLLRRADGGFDQRDVEAGLGQSLAPVGQVHLGKGAPQRKQFDERETGVDQPAPVVKCRIERDPAREQHIVKMPSLLHRLGEAQFVGLDHSILVVEDADLVEKALQPSR